MRPSSSCISESGCCVIRNRMMSVVNRCYCVISLVCTARTPRPRTRQQRVRWPEQLDGKKRSRDGVETTTLMVRMSHRRFSGSRRRRAALALASNGIYKLRPLVLFGLQPRGKREETQVFWKNALFLPAVIQPPTNIHYSCISVRKEEI